MKQTEKPFVLILSTKRYITTLASAHAHTGKMVQCILAHVLVCFLPNSHMWQSNQKHVDKVCLCTGKCSHVHVMLGRQYQNNWFLSLLHKLLSIWSVILVSIFITVPLVCCVSFRCQYLCGVEFLTSCLHFCTVVHEDSNASIERVRDWGHF